MVIKYEDKFPANNIIAPNAEYPTGSAKNETEAGRTDDGTFVNAIIANDFLGMQHAILKEANVAASGQYETKLNSDVLKSLKKIFQSRMVAGGYWNDIVGTNLTKDDKRKYWIYDKKPYGIVVTYNKFPIKVPDKPTNQPSIFYLIDDLKRFEMVKEEKTAVPVGGYLDFAFDDKPIKNFLKADGRLVYKSQYPDLFNVIGRTFCLPSDSNASFRLPKLDDVKVEKQGSASTKEKCNYKYALSFNASTQDLTFYFKNKLQYGAYAAPKKIFIYLVEGEKQTYQKTITNGQFKNLTAITSYTIDEKTFLATTDRSAKKVHIISVDDNYQIAFQIQGTDMPNDYFGDIRGICSYKIGSTQYLAVSDYGKKFIYIFSVTQTKANFIFKITSNDILGNSFTSPVGLEVFEANNLHYLAVTDLVTRKVFVFNIKEDSVTFKYEINKSGSTNFQTPSDVCSYFLNGKTFLAIADYYTKKIFIMNFTEKEAKEEFVITTQDVVSDNFQMPKSVKAFLEKEKQYLAIGDLQKKAFIFEHLKISTSQVIYQSFRHIRY